MNRFLRFLSLSLLITAAIAQAAPLTADLGQGLVYYRAHSLTAELPAVDAAHTQPCVLDLRFATGDGAAAAALSGWLKDHAQPRTPVFILANAATSSALRDVIAHRSTNSPTFVVIGPPTGAFTPDLALAVPPDVDRAAYDAADHGTPLDKLITEVVEKTRNDEARIARERLPSPLENQTPNPLESPAPSTSPAETPTPPAPPALLDRVLQRAVQLHRALLALKKL